MHKELTRSNKTKKIKKMKINMSKKEKERFDKLNSMNPNNWKPNEEYEFYLLLGKKYLGDANRKTKKYTQSGRAFYKEQGKLALMKAEKIKNKYKLV